MENNRNIFEGAKFGDKFVCRNGDISVYFSDSGALRNCVILGSVGIWEYDDTGKDLYEGYELESDIVARLEEPINEEVEQLKDELDALNMRYLSQVSLYKSLYEETKKKLEKYEHD